MEYASTTTPIESSGHNSSLGTLPFSSKTPTPEPLLTWYCEEGHLEASADRLASNCQPLQSRCSRDTCSPDDALVPAIGRRCTEVESEARNVDHILTRTLLPEISREFLARMAAGEAITKVHVSVDGQGGFHYEIA